MHEPRLDEPGDEDSFPLIAVFDGMLIDSEIRLSGVYISGNSVIINQTGTNYRPCPPDIP